MSMKGRKNPNAGRKEILVDVDKVEALAATGLTEEQIAKSLGINWKTLAARKRKYAEFMEALEGGKAKGIAKVSNSLFQSAVSGNYQAQSFYLKNRDPDNWKDKHDIGVSGEVTFNLQFGE